ncbi:MAG TPA: flippase activity-associated protein Agl23 [Verrucomicrobiae bacterium]|nr:flippase activity-associated protein Agl23 [Verrucomicrobiae bacterium]
MNRWRALAALLVFAGALAFRLPKLETRPLHNDEAVNAVKVAELWQQGRYAYDPDEYHGPTLHYATLPFLSMSGARGPGELRDGTLRLAPVLFGAGLILLLLLFLGGLSAHALAWSALFIAISPAMVFYSRYFIHEMLLVFFAALTLGTGWRYTRNPAAGWALLAGAGLGLMFATKETFVITVVAMGAAGLASVFSLSNRPASLRDLLRRVRWRDVGLAFAAAFIIWLLFFSSFFSNFAGLLDSARTYLPWLKRAAGHSPHVHPWYFYLQRLGWFHPVKGPAWSEGLILVLAALGAITSFRRKGSPLVRFLVVYTFALTAAYSAISYKTPWCLLSFFHGMILLAGFGAAALVEQIRAGALRIGMITLLLAFSSQLAVQAWRASFVYASDRRNPYVYAQTVPDIFNLVRRAEDLARVSPAAFETVIKVIAPQSDYWPLPWYLRRFDHIGWYEKVPEDPYAPIIIVSSKMDARLDEKSERKWIMTGLTELRPGQFFELYVELALWTKYVETLPPEPD